MPTVGRAGPAHPDRADVAAVMLVYVLMRGTRFGLRLKAVGKSPRSAHLLGSSTERYTLAAFLLCGGLRGSPARSSSPACSTSSCPRSRAGMGSWILVVLLAGYRAADRPSSRSSSRRSRWGARSCRSGWISTHRSAASCRVLVLFVILFGAGVRAGRAGAPPSWSRGPSWSRRCHSGGGDARDDRGLGERLVYAVVGETVTEKAGVVNLSMEGTIMLSAMTGFAVAYTTGSVLLGFLAAAGVGCSSHVRRVREHRAAARTRSRSGS